MGEALKVLRYEWDIGGPFCHMDKVALRCSLGVLQTMALVLKQW